MLSRKITSKMKQRSELIAVSLQSKIYNRKLSIQQQRTINSIRNDISASIEAVIMELAQGTLELESANLIIEEEAKNRVEKKPKTRFSLTQEQEKRQILIQIRTALRESRDKYHIVNPINTALQLQQLSGGELNVSIKTVVENFIERKDFEGAMAICNEFLNRGKGTQLYQDMLKLMRKIKCAEISDLVLRGINMQGTIQDEDAYVHLIEKGLKMGNIKMEAVSLGKSKDGRRNITLADVWEEKSVFKSH